ncbi:hypothetical protein CAAN3_04S04456 [[Candida] anglica]
MFEDTLCVVDGNPCEQGSLYCSDTCRDVDLSEIDNVFYNGNGSLDSLTEPMSPDVFAHTEIQSPDYLLYACCFCKATHAAASPCVEANYTLKSNNTNLDDQDTRSFSISTMSNPTILETLQHYTEDIDEEDMSVARSNHFIQHNYRKWLVMGKA